MKISKREKDRIRQNDRAFFIRALGYRYMGNYQVDHDWENGCVCRLVSRKENIRLRQLRGEWSNGTGT